MSQIYKVPVKIRTHVLQATTGHLDLMTSHHFLVEAENEREAISKLRIEPSFYKNYNRLSETMRGKLNPFKLRKDKIEKVLECDFRDKNKREEYTCGELSDSFEENSQGLFGMCCIEGYAIPEYPEGCPYKNKEIA